MLERYSQYNSTSLAGDCYHESKKKEFDISFCHNKLKLRYTKYDNDKEYFLPILTTQLEKNLLRMPSWRSAMERKVAGEQLGQANAAIYNLNSYIETLNKRIQPTDQYGTIYFDTGNGFNEDEIYRFQHNLDTKQFSKEIILPQNTKSIRFDPVEGYGCFIQNLAIITYNDEPLDYQVLNGLKSENNGIVFTTIDPQIFIDVSKKAAEKIKIQCNIWFFN